MQFNKVLSTLQPQKQDMVIKGNPVDLNESISVKIDSSELTKESSTESTSNNKLELFKYEEEQVYLLDKRFQRLHRDSVKLLEKSQHYDKITRFIKGFIIVFSLGSSYLSAISGIDEVQKSYLITAFSLACAIGSGISSVKNFSSESTRLYMGYTHYQLKCSEVEQSFYHFEGSMPYDDLILSIDKLFTEYERDIDKTTDQRLANAEKRLVYTQEVMENYLKDKNGGELPQWYQNKVKVENHKERYDLNNKEKNSSELDQKSITKVESKSLVRRILDKIVSKK
jgi:hypothetical protein